MTVSDLGVYNNNASNKFYSVTVVAKGYVAESDMYQYVSFSDVGLIYNLSNGKIPQV